MHTTLKTQIVTVFICGSSVDPMYSMVIELALYSGNLFTDQNIRIFITKEKGCYNQMLHVLAGLPVAIISKCTHI